jgi:hypothetical protein
MPQPIKDHSRSCKVTEIFPFSAVLASLPEKYYFPKMNRLSGSGITFRLWNLAYLRFEVWSLKFALCLVAFCTCVNFTHAATITVTTNDTYAKIEGANPGDEVVISPGTYSFRVYLTKQATPNNPINIHALDPSNPPVWDFGTNLVENAPGSYGAGDNGRGGWQFSGAQNYNISGIVFRNCRPPPKMPEAFATTTAPPTSISKIAFSP